MEVETENVGEGTENDRAVPPVNEDSNSLNHQNCRPEGTMSGSSAGPREIYMYKVRDDFKSTNGQESCNRKQCLCDQNSVQENVRRFCEALSNLISCRRALCTHTFSKILEGNVCDVYCTWMEWHDVHRSVISSFSSKISYGEDESEEGHEIGGEGTGSKVSSSSEAELGCESHTVEACKTAGAAQNPNSTDRLSKINEKGTGEVEPVREQVFSGAFYLQPSLFENDDEEELEEVTINGSSDVEIIENQQEDTTRTLTNDAPHSESEERGQTKSSTVPVSGTRPKTSTCGSNLESNGETISNSVEVGRTLIQRESDKDVPELEGDAGICFSLPSERTVRLTFGAVMNPILDTTPTPVPPGTPSCHDSSGSSQSQDLIIDERSNSGGSDDIDERSLNSENNSVPSSTAIQRVEVEVVDLTVDSPVAFTDASLPLSTPLPRTSSSECISNQNTVTKAKDNEKRKSNATKTNKTDGAQCVSDMFESELERIKESNGQFKIIHDTLKNKDRNPPLIEIEDGEIVENSVTVSQNSPQSNSHQSKDQEKERACRERKNKRSDFNSKEPASMPTSTYQPRRKRDAKTKATERFLEWGKLLNSNSNGNSCSRRSNKRRQILDSEDEYEHKKKTGSRK